MEEKENKEVHGLACKGALHSQRPPPKKGFEMSTLQGKQGQNLTENLAKNLTKNLTRNLAKNLNPQDSITILLHLLDLCPSTQTIW